VAAAVGVFERGDDGGEDAAFPGLDLFVVDGADDADGVASEVAAYVWDF